VVHYLTEELVKRGHDVTLFATGDSTNTAKLEATFDEQMPDRIGETFYDVQHVATCLRRAGEFDIIHDHSGFAGVAFAELVDTPMVHTLHGPFTHDICRFYQEFRDSVHYVSISDYQRSCCPDLQHAGTVYNPIDVEGWPYRGREEKEDYLLAFGRLCEDKGFHTAIEVAKRTGEKLVIAGEAAVVMDDIELSRVAQAGSYMLHVIKGLTDAVGHLLIKGSFQLRRGRGVPRREEGDIMPALHQFFSEVVYDPFNSSITRGRNLDPWGSQHGDLHGIFYPGRFDSNPLRGRGRRFPRDRR